MKFSQLNNKNYRKEDVQLSSMSPMPEGSPRYWLKEKTCNTNVVYKGIQSTRLEMLGNGNRL